MANKKNLSDYLKVTFELLEAAENNQITPKASGEYHPRAFGMNANTGKKIYHKKHIKQSINRILTTKLNSRFASRDFGSELLNLSDVPTNKTGLLRLQQAINIALSEQEFRIDLNKAQVFLNNEGKIDYNLDYDILEF